MPLCYLFSFKSAYKLQTEFWDCCLSSPFSLMFQSPPKSTENISSNQVFSFKAQNQFIPVMQTLCNDDWSKKTVDQKVSFLNILC